MPSSECIEWPHARDRGGYGVTWRGGKKVSAHRAALADKLGLSLDELDGLACHTCDNRACINHDHLYLGTYKTNSDDRVSRFRTDKGAAGTHSVLDEETVLEIRRRYVPRCRVNGTKALGIEFGITQANVSAIVNYKTWRHLP